MYIGKYAFNSKEQAQEKIDALGIETDENGKEYPTHKHSIVELGNIVLEQGEYDESGEEISAPVLSDKWHLDVAWRLEDSYDEDGNLIEADHPYGWKSHAVKIEGDGVHSFFGLKYDELKFN
jgi:hypothetical protein